MSGAGDAVSGFDNITLYPPNGTAKRIDDVRERTRSAWLVGAAMARLSGEERAQQAGIDLEEGWINEAVGEYLDRQELEING